MNMDINQPRRQNSVAEIYYATVGRRPTLLSGGDFHDDAALQQHEWLLDPFERSKQCRSGQRDHRLSDLFYRSPGFPLVRPILKCGTEAPRVPCAQTLNKAGAVGVSRFRPEHW